MRVILQRVKKASVTVNNKITASIDSGLLILLGIENNDTNEDLEWLVKKILQLRIFNDKQGVMNLSVSDVSGQIIVVSQFTLHANIKKGNRPSYIRAAKPNLAEPMYLLFTEKLKQNSTLNIQTGIFGAMMDIDLINDGPVTIFIDSKNKE